MRAGLLYYHKVLAIVGDILHLKVPQRVSAGSVCLHDLAVVEDEGGICSLAQVIALRREEVALQLFSGSRGFSTRARVHFLGYPLAVPYSRNLLGRILDGAGRPRDGGPSLTEEPQIPAVSSTVNPLRRRLASRLIRTDVPMIDLFNCLVESQKIPIFSVYGEPYNALLARIGIQADADLVVFGGMGLIYDDYHFFCEAFEEAGSLGRTIMFCNLAQDSPVERLLVPDLALAVAERFAVEENLRVLVLLTDMTAFTEALKEISIALERVPANRGYPGDLYSQLARRYERACDYQDAGSVTILSVTTVPGDDITHPVPDNTGYITEGQYYLRGGMLDPFASLSRLKQHVIGRVTREDHAEVMNALIRLYAGAREAEQKQAMAFELSPFDIKLLRFGELFRQRFMDIKVSMPLEAALDLGWHTLAECFEPSELLMKRELVAKYYPKEMKLETSAE
jgi:V/A-type H+-transporting ATPase subunit B